MAERRLLLIKSFLESAEGRVLDFGCGTGSSVTHFATIFPDKKFLGLDTDKKFIEYARQKYPRDNVEFTYDTIDLVKGPFGFIYSIDVLHHIEDVDKIIKKIYEILGPGSKWMVIEPNIWNPKVFLNQFLKNDERLFFQNNTEKIFRSAGFEIRTKGRFLLIPYQFKNPSELFIRLENRFESFFGGSVFYVLEKKI